MPINPTDTYSSANRLVPIYDSINEARQLPCNLQENQTYLRGQVLSLITGQNQIVVATPSSAFSTGQVTITVDGRSTTSFLPTDTLATIQPLIDALPNVGPGNLVVSGGLFNAGTPLTFTFQNALGSRPAPQVVVSLVGAPAGVTVATAVTQVGHSNATYAPYNSARLANPTAAPVPSAAAGGSAFPAGTYSVAYSFVDATGGETLISPVATVTTASANLSIALATITLPAGAASVNWYVSTLAGSSNLALAANNNGQSFTLATAPAAGAKSPVQTATAYSQTGGTGSNKAAALLAFPALTDAQGFSRVYERGPLSNVFSMYVSGTFQTSMLAGFDQKAANDLGGVLVSGTLTNGIYRWG